MPRISTEIRIQVALRAGHKCEYCKSPEKYSISGFSMEHVTPTSKGGTSTIENLALACQQCNNHKYNAVEALDPVSEETYKLFNPRSAKWENHFAWDYQYLHVVGLTGMGRATVYRLNLNRKGIVNLRSLLAANDLHP